MSSFLGGYVTLRLKWLASAAAFVAIMSIVVPVSSQISNAKPRVGRIVGNLDGISQDGDHFFISGWVCQQGQTKSIAINVYGEDPKDASKRVFLIAQFANLYNEPAVAQVCQERGGGKHRFVVLLPYGYGPDSKLYVHGIRLIDGVPNDTITGSGVKLVRLPVLITPHPSFPRLAGSYHSLAQDPRVFMNPADLRDFAARVSRPNSYSQRRFGMLAEQTRRDLACGIDWDVTYAGCDGWIYQYTFSSEPQDHHEAEVRAQL